ncbi:hypothetical protein B0T16DRAFT_136478 [Cercophora newfieldiana]|uniref:Ankyrin n=1 Tax=Cercophora newfieldiana TaxID=92897 RepID=A0AA39YDY7_9PEZI|nr:hypothetical protein B0T16DRAFT_136478 [Cercophora newfieldiana]
MSFGLSPSDILNVVKYCWQLVEKSKSAPSEFAEIARNVEGLHSVLLAVQNEVDNAESLLHRNETIAVNLSSSIKAVRETVLPKLESVLARFPSLSTEKPKVLDRLRFPAKRDLLEIRGLLAFNIQLISTHIETLQIGALERVENLGNLQAKSLGRIESSLDQALPRILEFIDVFGAEIRASPEPSKALSDDNQQAWATFRDRLERMGFTHSLLEKHESAILDRIQELREEGLLTSDAPSDSEPEVRHNSSQNYHMPYYETETESDASSILSPRTSRPYSWSKHEPSPESARKKQQDRWSPVLPSQREVDNDSISDADSEATITPASTPPRSQVDTRRPKPFRGSLNTPDNDDARPERPAPERRSTSYSLPGGNLVSPRTGLDGTTRKSSTKEEHRRWQAEPNVEDVRRTRPGDNTNPVPGPRPPPTWRYRTQRYITPRFKTGDKNSGALARAAGYRSLPDIKRLLESGANLESSDPPPVNQDGSASGPRKTALTIAVERGRFDIVKFLLECGANINMAELSEPVKTGNTRLARLLLEYGYPTFYPVGYWLNLAVDLGSLELCDLFLEYGANVNSQDMKGSTALLQAAWQGRKAIVDMLLREGASVHVICKSGQTALYKASGQGYEDITRRLLDCGARPNEGRGADGETALFKAVSKGHLGVARLLLEAGADPNIPNDYRRRVGMVEGYVNGNWHELFLSTPSSEVFPKFDWKPKSMIAKYLRQQIQPQSPCQYPLHSAAGNRTVGMELAEMLLAAGARVDVEDGEGGLPIDYAAAGDFGEIVTLLKRYGSPSARREQSRGRGLRLSENAVETLIAEAATFLTKGRPETRP